jgi:hypothetical protein
MPMAPTSVTSIAPAIHHIEDSKSVIKLHLFIAATTAVRQPDVELRQALVGAFDADSTWVERPGMKARGCGLVYVANRYNAKWCLEEVA